MQVSAWVRGREVALVAFEFGSVRDPHEHLQDEVRTRHWTVGAGGTPQIEFHAELKTALMDKHRGLLGRRGHLWATGQAASALRTLAAGVPWEDHQLLCPSTLIWTARRVPAAHFRVPAVSGLVEGNALHEAVQQAVLLQAAFRALSLHKVPPGKPPRVAIP